jgi:hypothetical protein
VNSPLLLWVGRNWLFTMDVAGGTPESTELPGRAPRLSEALSRQWRLSLHGVRYKESSSESENARMALSFG